MKRSIGLLGAAALAVTPAVVLAQGSAPRPVMPSPQSPQAAAPKMPTAEQLETITPDQVALRLHRFNQLEMAEAQVALSRAQSPQVREFAQAILTGHREMDQKLTQLASTKGWKLEGQKYNLDSAAIASAAMDRRERLQQASGRRFDTQFMAGVPLIQLTNLGYIEVAELGNVRDRELRKLMDESKRTLQQHLDQSVSLLHQINVAAGQGSTRGG